MPYPLCDIMHQNWFRRVSPVKIICHTKQVHTWFSSSNDNAVRSMVSLWWAYSKRINSIHSSTSYIMLRSSLCATQYANFVLFFFWVKMQMPEENFEIPFIWIVYFFKRNIWLVVKKIKYSRNHGFMKINLSGLTSFTCRQSNRTVLFQ